MKIKKTILTFSILLSLILAASCSADFDARRGIIKFMEGNKGLEKYLHAPVTVSQTDDRILLIRDKGIYGFQYQLLRPNSSCDPNVVIDRDIVLNPHIDKLVVVTHGWFEKADNQWPSDMTESISRCADPNQWLCAAYDWRGGSGALLSIQAAKYARDIAGPRLAKAILSLDVDFKHIHLIGHSAGTWAINSAAKHIAAVKPGTHFHLTFLDAYVPIQWEQDKLGSIHENAERQQTHIWAEHYFIKDITMGVTEHILKYAHNVDITAIDPYFHEHLFPCRWYQATITGTYERWDEKNETVHARRGNIEYGFARSLESGEKNWIRSRALKTNGTPIKIKRFSSNKVG